MKRVGLERIIIGHAMDNCITRQIHPDAKKRRSFLAMHLLTSGDLQRYAMKSTLSDTEENN